MMLIKTTAISLMLLVLSCLCGNSQTFHKTLKNPNNLFSQRMLRFEDGSYLIGDSFLTEGEIYLSRFYKCGDLDWSQGYRIEGSFAEFRDFITTSNGDLIVFGSYFVGNLELIFVQKINPVNGKQISFTTFDPIYQDHFTYSIDIRNGEIMLFGLLLDFNIERRGFLAVLDENLGIKWTKQFKPFEKEGQAIIVDGGFSARSEKYHITFDHLGEIIWVKALEADNDEVLPIGGPLEVENGYVYEATVNGQNFFYKLNDAGGVIWQSKLFKTTGVRSELLLESDGSILVSFYASVNNSTVLAQMKLSSSGALSEQRYLSADMAFASGSLQLSQYMNVSTLVGSPEPFTNFQDAFQDFVIQIDPSADPNCHITEAYDDLMMNDILIRLEDVPFDFLPLEMEAVTSSAVSFIPYDIDFDDVCSDAGDPLIEEEVFLLQCGSSLELTLPTGEYQWDDLRNAQDRVVSDPGKYSARSMECENKKVLNYLVQSPECECKVYFPTAISPNSDGFNDQYEYYSDCQVSAIDLRIYNRWGEQVFANNVVGQFWKADNAGSGVYVAQGSYEIRSPSGELIRKEFTQSVTVFK